MDNRFYDNELEHYLRDQTDQHRMYPSDQVWRNIQSEIHGYKKWPALTFISIFVISSLVISTVLLKPHVQVASINLNTSGKTNTITEKAPSSTFSENEKNFTDKLSVEKITRQTIDKVIENVEAKPSEETFVVPESSQENSAAVTTNTMENNQKAARESIQNIKLSDVQKPSGTLV